MSGNRMIAALLASLLLPARVWAAEEPPIVNSSFERAGDKGELAT